MFIEIIYTEYNVNRSLKAISEMQQRDRAEINTTGFTSCLNKYVYCFFNVFVYVYFFFCLLIYFFVISKHKLVADS